MRHDELTSPYQILSPAADIRHVNPTFSRHSQEIRTESQCMTTSIARYHLPQISWCTRQTYLHPSTLGRSRCLSRGRALLHNDLHDSHNIDRHWFQWDALTLTVLLHSRTLYGSRWPRTYLRICHHARDAYGQLLTSPRKLFHLTRILDSMSLSSTWCHMLRIIEGVARVLPPHGLVRCLFFPRGWYLHSVT
jgi:hypothetical protein